MQKQNIHLSIHSFNQHLLSPYCVPGTVLVEDIMVSKNRHVPDLLELGVTYV